MRLLWPTLWYASRKPGLFSMTHPSDCCEEQQTTSRCDEISSIVGLAENMDEIGNGDATPVPVYTEASWRTSVYIFLAYFAEVIAAQTPGTLLPYMGNDLGFSSSDSARIAAVATASVCASKLLMGPAVDYLGGKTSSQLSLGAVVLILVALGKLAHSSLVIGGLFAASQWFNAPMWPAQAVIMQERLPPDRLDRYFRMLSISSRLGVFTSMLVTGALLSRLSWQAVTWVISAFGGVMLLGTAPLISRRPRRPVGPHLERDGQTMLVADSTRLSQDSLSKLSRVKLLPSESLSTSSTLHSSPLQRPTRTAQPTRPRLRARVWMLLCTPWYRWSLLTMAGLMCVTNMTLLISTYFTDATRGTDVPAWLAAVLAAVFPAGLLVCVVLPGRWYPRVSFARQRTLCIALQGVSLCSAIGLALMGNSALTNKTMLGIRVMLVFLLTFGLGIAYYIPLHAASVRYAPQDAGLCNSSIDGVGYLFSVLYQLAMGALLDSPLGWHGVWTMAAACIALSVFGMHQFFKATSILRCQISVHEAHVVRTHETIPMEDIQHQPLSQSPSPQVTETVATRNHDAPHGKSDDVHPPGQKTSRLPGPQKAFAKKVHHKLPTSLPRHPYSSTRKPRIQDEDALQALLDVKNYSDEN
eukprot:m.7904 g.7904  ORF g.7904 m.7904 type:complete len:640 (+) comp5973_c0_seq1:447-2366(+)